LTPPNVVNLKVEQNNCHHQSPPHCKPWSTVDVLPSSTKLKVIDATLAKILAVRLDPKFAFALHLFAFRFVCCVSCFVTIVLDVNLHRPSTTLQIIVHNWFHL